MNYMRDDVEKSVLRRATFIINGLRENIFAEEDFL